MDLRPPLLDGRARPQLARPAAGAVHRGDPAPRGRAGSRAPGLPGAAVRAGEPQLLRHLPGLDDGRMGVRDAHGRGGRLRPAARRQQRLRVELQSRHGPGPLHPLPAARADRAVPPRRAREPYPVHHRHPRQPRDRSGLGALPHRPPAHRRRLHPARVGRQHPPLPGGPRGGAQGQAVHGRASAGDGAGGNHGPEETTEPEPVLATVHETVFHPLHTIRAEVE